MSRKNNKRIRYSKKKKKYPMPKQKMQKLEKLAERIILVGTFEKSRNFGFVVPERTEKKLIQMYLYQKNIQKVQKMEIRY